MTSLSNLAKLSKYRHFNHEIIILWVQWYVSYKLSYRNLVELMAERGVELARTHAGGLEHRASVRSLLYTGFVEPLEHRGRDRRGHARRRMSGSTIRPRQARFCRVHGRSPTARRLRAPRRAKTTFRAAAG